jgi:hypothetical protein
MDARDQMCSVSRVSFDLSKESNHHIASSANDKISMQPGPITQEAFTTTKGENIVNDHVQVKLNPTILLTKGCCFLNFQIGHLKDKDQEFHQDGFLWPPVLAHPKPDSFNKMIKPKRQTRVSGKSLVSSFLISELQQQAVGLQVQTICLIVVDDLFQHHPTTNFRTKPKDITITTNAKFSCVLQFFIFHPWPA